jgi:hypothetical protein
VEGVPEDVLVPVSAGRLVRQARDLPVVPAHPAAPGVGDREPVCRGVGLDVVEDVVHVDVGEMRAGECVELVDEADEAAVEDADGAVDALDAGGAVGAVPRQLVGGAPDLPHPDHHHLARAIVVEHLQVPPVVGDERVRELLGRVPAARVVDARHEVVVQVVVAAHAYAEDTLAQTVRRRVLIAQDVHHRLHRRLEVLHLTGERDTAALRARPLLLLLLSLSACSMSTVVSCFNSHAYQLLACLGADAGGRGGEVGAVEDLVAARAGERRDEVVEAQELSCTFRESSVHMHG